MLTPSASRQSAAPLFDEAALLPCFATGTPPAAITMADVVEILKELDWSPPVPTISSASTLCSRRTPFALIVAAHPVISSMVSPFIANAVRKAAICTWVVSPLIISFITCDASSYVKFCLFASLIIACLIIYLTSRKFFKIVMPSGVIMDSG